MSFAKLSCKEFLTRIESNLDNTIEAMERRALAYAGGPKAAILILLQVIDEELCMLFTLRARTLNSHPSEVSFVGGKLDEGETVVDAALREAREEVGLHERFVERVFGATSPVISKSGIMCFPLAVLVNARWRPTPSPSEVEDYFYCSFSHLLSNPDAWKPFQIATGHRFFRIAAPAPREHLNIYGLTAMVVVDFFENALRLNPLEFGSHFLSEDDRERFYRYFKHAEHALSRGRVDAVMIGRWRRANPKL